MKVANQKIRIRLKGYDHEIVDQSTKLIVDTAQKNSLRLINVRKNFLTTDRFTERLCADGIHPNEAGHDTILDSFLGYVHSL